MGSLLLDGKSLARSLEVQISERVAVLRRKWGDVKPILATILVGNDPASATYVRMKGNTCERVGMESLRVALPEATTTCEVLRTIDALNNNPRVQGILLQHPAPRQIDERRCFDEISLDKDVDGVTSLGFGRMALGAAAYGSATPAGIMRLLAHYKISVDGKEAVVVGRSAILGRPMAMMLLRANATVTICHSRTSNLSEVVGRAEIIVGAVGKPEFIKGKWIRDGAVVVDAAYHPGSVGDIELDTIRDRSAAWTPVPGGVGPMTIATLIAHTLDSAEKYGERVVPG